MKLLPTLVKNLVAFTVTDKHPKNDGNQPEHVPTCAIYRNVNQ